MLLLIVLGFCAYAGWHRWPWPWPTYIFGALLPLWAVQAYMINDWRVQAGLVGFNLETLLANATIQLVLLYTVFFIARGLSHLASRNR
jgi:hypothetical protein